MKPVLLTCSLVASILMSGCAFSNSKLDLKYDESLARSGPLSSLSPVKIKIEPLQDGRRFFDKIGDKKNGYGMDCADVVTTSPVPDIVRDSIIVMLQKNGHIVTDDEADVLVKGVIETFWLESQMNFWTIEYMGTADVTLEFKDAATQAVLLNKKFSGHHNEQFYSGFDKEVRAVMNQTLEDLMNSILMDRKLVEILQPYSNRQAGSI